MHYYQHHIGDFIKDTSFLSNEDVGIYLKMLWIYYDSEKPLPNNIDLLSIKLNADGGKISTILSVFFSLQNDEWHHSRCDQEIAIYHELIEKKSRAGKASADSRRIKSTPVEQTNNISASNEQLTNNHEPITNNHKPIKNIITPIGVSDSVFKDYLQLRNKLKAPVTETAIKGLEKEAAKAGMSLEAVMILCCQNGWRGFKADWIKDKGAISQNKERNQTVLQGLTRGLMGGDKNVGLLSE